MLLKQIVACARKRKPMSKAKPNISWQTKTGDTTDFKRSRKDAMHKNKTKTNSCMHNKTKQKITGKAKPKHLTAKENWRYEKF